MSVSVVINATRSNSGHRDSKPATALPRSQSKSAFIHRKVWREESAKPSSRQSELSPGSLPAANINGNIPGRKIRAIPDSPGRSALNAPNNLAERLETQAVLDSTPLELWQYIAKMREEEQGSQDIITKSELLNSKFYALYQELSVYELCLPTLKTFIVDYLMYGKQQKVWDRPLLRVMQKLCEEGSNRTIAVMLEQAKSDYKRLGHNYPFREFLDYFNHRAIDVFDIEPDPDTESHHTGKKNVISGKTGDDSELLTEVRAATSNPVDAVPELAEAATSSTGAIYGGKTAGTVFAVGAFLSMLPVGSGSTTPDNLSYGSPMTGPSAGSSTAPSAGSSTAPSAGWSTAPSADSSTAPSADSSTAPSAGSSTPPSADNGSSIPSKAMDQQGIAEKSPTPNPYYTCNDGTKIRISTLCDGFDHCGDGSDENINHDKCREGVNSGILYQCSNNKTISASYICDGINQCGDWSEENVNLKSCQDRLNQGNLFQCAHNGTVRRSDVCNYKNDCGDNSDELTTGKNATCFICPDTNYKFSVKNLCDGVVHCYGSNYDEQYSLCHEQVEAGKLFRCENDITIPIERACDSVADCDDGSDENTGKSPTCFQCSNSEIIKAEMMCNGFPDCRNGLDETIGSPGSSCLSCNDNTTIPVHQRCDGISQCLDGSDERLCPTTMAGTTPSTSTSTSTSTITSENTGIPSAVSVPPAHETNYQPPGNSGSLGPYAGTFVLGALTIGTVAYCASLVKNRALLVSGKPSVWLLAPFRDFRHYFYPPVAADSESGNPDSEHGQLSMGMPQVLSSTA